MRKSSACKLLLLLLAVASVLGVLVTPAAEAEYCPDTHFNCYFIGMNYYPTGTSCCMYQCPDGRIRRGICYDATV